MGMSVDGGIVTPGGDNAGEPVPVGAELTESPVAGRNVGSGVLGEELSGVEALLESVGNEFGVSEDAGKLSLFGSTGDVVGLAVPPVSKRNVGDGAVGGGVDPSLLLGGEELIPSIGVDTGSGEGVVTSAGSGTGTSGDATPTESAGGGVVASVGGGKGASDDTGSAGGGAGASVDVVVAGLAVPPVSKRNVGDGAVGGGVDPSLLLGGEELIPSIGVDTGSGEGVVTSAGSGTGTSGDATPTESAGGGVVASVGGGKGASDDTGSAGGGAGASVDVVVAGLAVPPVSKRNVGDGAVGGGVDLSLLLGSEELVGVESLMLGISSFSVEVKSEWDVGFSVSVKEFSADADPDWADTIPSTTVTKKTVKNKRVMLVAW
ncbi:hypothetical protein PC113_g8146 [Phytophthora cactorum]|uniref:Uncharacterized protein n=1 Tax=Phytophthora cactorum TaxID=29920 RepID=A0A8T0ZEV2_9STRA|nr:hypothetical protein PC113_g8146 [Phytophthora cactorum]KAG2929268.1 hypothetical protein PC115_g6939 [Phytophthora cactorum]KAG3090722.1 hypothetical protein PC122_g7302 [Phytophthora cactorum]